jgi:protein-disulfide isomerase
MTADVHLLKQSVTADDWMRGAADAPITLVEYADFQCPDCQESYPVLERVLDSYAGRMRFVFRHFPVVTRHPLAQGAALAAEAAGKQGKFWEMHQRLFEARSALAPEDLRRYAQQIGLDLARFEQDVADPALVAKIHESKLLGVRSGVNGTPTIFLNGVRHDRPTPAVEESDLRAAIEALLRDVV